MSDDVTAVFALHGFRVLGIDLVANELVLLVETLRRPVGCQPAVRSPGSKTGGR